jgi:hypothetical protein
MLSDLARKLYAEKIIVVPIINVAASGAAGVLENVPSNADTVFATLIAPRNLKLKGVGVSWATGGGTGPTLTAKVTDIAAAVLASSGLATSITTEGGVYAEDANVFVSKGTVLCLTLRSNNADNDFTGCAITVVFEAPASDD